MIKIKASLFKEKESYTVYVSDVRNEDSYIVYSGINKILVYDYDHNVAPGDTLTLTLKINSSNKSYLTDFDYESYLFSKGISLSARATSRRFIKHGFSINSVKYYYLKYLKNNLSEDSYNYVLAMVFGDNNLEDDIKDGYSALGISHVLAISGLHILFLYKIISFIMLKLFHYYRNKIPIILITMFVLFIGAPASCLRALLFLILGELNKSGNTKYTRLDILSISCILMLIYSPYFAYQAGFLLSFLVNFVLIYSNEIIGKSKSKLLGSYKTYILIFLSTLPIVVNFSNVISLLSILLSPILSLLISFILLPICYIESILPITDYIFKYFFIALNLYIVGLKNIAIFIHIKSFNIYMSAIYYSLLILGVYSKIKNKHVIISIGILSGYMLGILLIDFVNPFGSVTFIDVGQGDSCIVRLPFNKGVMVIDAYNSFEYIRSTGITKIDYLVLTHSDNDHIGDYKEIIEYFDVGCLLYPEYDTKFSEVLDGIDVVSYPVNDNTKIKSKKFSFNILGPINSYSDANSNSIVIRLEIYSSIFMLTGDMTEAEENDILAKYEKELDSDILKVAHHGSNTSSSLAFLNAVSPSYSIISVGENNTYGLPNSEIIERLSSLSKVYMTKVSGNITVKVIKNSFKIYTYR